LIFDQEFIRCSAIQPTVFEVVVCIVPHSDLSPQVRERRERVSIIERLLIAAMAPFHRSVLRGLSRIDEVVDDSLCRTESIKGMDCLHRQIGALVRAEVVVCERGSVVRLHPGNGMGETGDHVLKEEDGFPASVSVEDPKIAPPRGGINRRVLEILFSCHISRHFLDVDLHEFPWLPFRSEVLVFHFFHAVFSREPLFFQDLPDGTFMDLDPFLRKLPVKLLRAETPFLSQGDHALSEPERCLPAIPLGFCGMRH